VTFIVPSYLSIHSSVLVFMSTTGRGFQIEYPAITLHAVSRAEAGPSIYCQLDEYAGEAEGAASNDEMSDMRELSIVPQSASSRMFMEFSFPKISNPSYSGTNFRGPFSVCSFTS
jgi:nucleotide-sensitive chloride channel 1A